MVAGDAVLESNVASSSLRDRPYNEHDTGSVKADDLQGAGRTAPVVNTPVFTIAKILDKRSSPFGVKYRCELGPVWLSSVLVKEVPMGGVQIRSYENGLIRVGRLGTLRERKRKHSQM